MPLTLRIISPHKDLLGADSTKVFSVHGGTIGRAADNDWVLPDPDRFVSAHHAIVDYHGGGYYLTDTSSNGVFVNDSDQSVGSGAPLRLHNGDRLRMGSYRFAVSIVNVGREGTGDTGVFIAEDEPETGDAPAEAARTEEDGRDRLGLNLELVDEGPAPVSHHVPTDTEELTIIETVRDTVSAPSLPVEDVEREEDPTAQTQPVEILGETDVRQSLAILLEAVGADPGRLPAGEEDRFLAKLGHVIRASVSGLTGVFGDRSRSGPSADDHEFKNNPLRGEGDLEDTVEALLYYDGMDYAAPVDAVEEAFEDLRAHQIALSEAARAVWGDLLDRMAPVTLEANFNKGLTRGSLFGISNKAKYWDLYREFYESFARRADERYGEVFEQTYRRIYQAERERRSERKEPPAPPIKIPE